MSGKSYLDIVKEAVDNVGKRTPHEGFISNYELQLEVRRLRGLPTEGRASRNLDYRTLHKLGNKGVHWDTTGHRHSYTGGLFGRGSWEQSLSYEVRAINPHYKRGE